jgi:hypothetical protein
MLRKATGVLKPLPKRTCVHFTHFKILIASIQTRAFGLEEYPFENEHKENYTQRDINYAPPLV